MVRKDLDCYINDPDIIDEPMALREVHAIRLRISDETKGLTPEEHTEYFHEGAERFFARKETTKN
jgi:hypothetical protein